MLHCRKNRWCTHQQKEQKALTPFTHQKESVPSLVAYPDKGYDTKEGTDSFWDKWGEPPKPQEESDGLLVIHVIRLDMSELCPRTLLVDIQILFRHIERHIIEMMLFKDRFEISRPYFTTNSRRHSTPEIDLL